MKSVTRAFLLLNVYNLKAVFQCSFLEQIPECNSFGNTRITIPKKATILKPAVHVCTNMYELSPGIL